MALNYRRDNIGNLSFQLLWIDGLEQSNLMITMRVLAWSDFAAAWQDCSLTTDWLKAIGEKMVAHSYDFKTVHSIRIDERFFTPPLDIVMHEAHSNGVVPIELRFSSPDPRLEEGPCTVIASAEIGLLEAFGKRVRGLAEKGVGASCTMNPNVPAVPDYRYLMRGGC